MNDQNDESQNYALMVLAGLVLLVIGLVLGIAVWRGMPSTAGSPTASAVTAAVAGAPEGRIYFEIGSDALPGDAVEILVRVADAARADTAKVVLISGYHDASGDAAINAELSKKRAQAVRHALEANGVAPERLVLDKPMVATGSGDAREARRVEMRLR